MTFQVVSVVIAVAAAQIGDDAGGDQRPAARPAKILLDLISRVRAVRRVSLGVPG